MRNAPIIIALAATVLIPLPVPAQEAEVEVNVLGRGGAGKFDRANITREENKVIQGVFGKSDSDAIGAMIGSADGSVLVAGTGRPDLRPPAAKPPAAGETCFVARISPDLREMKVVLSLPADLISADCLGTSPDGSLVVAGQKRGGGILVVRVSGDLGKVLWSRAVVGDRPASVSVAPDGSVVVSPTETPFVSRIAADGSRLIPFGDKDTFRTDGGNPDIVKAWWEGCGYVAAGYKGGVNYHRGGNAGVVALPDGTFILFTTNFLTHPGGGPDFDPMLLKFDGSGKILWCTNLLDGLPAESDDKQPHMALDPHTGDLLLSAIQHGHFTHNFIATPGAYLTPHAWFTGNIMIGWIARVDPSNGKPKASTYYFPEMPGPAVNGKRRANSLFPQTPAADAAGNIYVTGGTAWKLETTLHAFQPEPLGSGSGFVTVFSPDLSRILYASLLTSKGYSLRGRAIVAAPGGPAVLAEFERDKSAESDFIGTNADATNYLNARPASARGSIIGFYPSSPWKE